MSDEDEERGEGGLRRHDGGTEGANKNGGEARPYIYLEPDSNVRVPSNQFGPLH